MKRIAFISVLLSLTITTVAVGQLPLDHFILSAFEDAEVKTFDEQVAFLEKKSYRMSPLRELEFRTQNRELLRTQQEYGLRLSPANPWEIRANNHYYKEYQNVLMFEKQLAFRQALFERYYTIIYFLYYQQLKEASAKGQLVLDQQLSIIEKQSGSHFFDADEFAKLKVDELDYAVELEEYDYEVANQIHRIERMYPAAHNQKILWSSVDIVTVDQIKIVVDSLVQSSAKSTFLAYQKQKIKLAQSQYNLEKANINPGFVQGSYDRRRVHQDRTPFNFSLGLTIPLTNPNRGDMARRKLQIIEADYDLKEAEEESEIDKVIIQDKLLKLINRYNSLRSRIDELLNSNFAQTLSAIKGGDPLMYVQFNERVRKLDVLLIKMERDIRLTYIDYLNFTDQLQQQPLVNFLAPALPFVQN